MAPLLYRRMKGANLFCTSPASTTACTGVEPRRRLVDRWYSIPHLRRERQRALHWMTHPQKSGRGSGKTGSLLSPTPSSRYLLSDDDGGGGEAFFDDFPDLDTLPAWIPVDSTRFHSVSENDDSAALKPSNFSSSSSSSSSAAASLPSASFQTGKGDDDVAATERSSTIARSQGQAFLGVSSSSGLGIHATRDEDSAVPTPSCSARSQDQVVVLRVSLHCKGCEGKVRKHISRMEGVTSFSIDFATKKVTVVGDVTPLGVLSSISKVKNAQFWTSP